MAKPTTRPSINAETGEIIDTPKSEVTALVKTDGNLTDMVKTNPKMVIRHFIKLKQGQAIEGVYRGLGDSIEKEELNPNTKQMELKVIPTIVLEVAPNIEVEMIQTHQMEKKLKPEVEGKKVGLQHLGQTDTGNGRRVNDILIAIER